MWFNEAQNNDHQYMTTQYLFMEYSAQSRAGSTEPCVLGPWSGWVDVPATRIQELGSHNHPPSPVAIHMCHCPHTRTPIIAGPWPDPQGSAFWFLPFPSCKTASRAALASQHRHRFSEHFTLFPITNLRQAFTCHRPTHLDRSQAGSPVSHASKRPRQHRTNGRTPSRGALLDAIWRGHGLLKCHPQTAFPA